MRKIFPALVILLASGTIYAQSNVSGRFSLSTGFDFGAHYTEWEAKYQGTTVDRDTSGAATTQFQFNAHYALAKWFSLGLGFKSGRYIQDPEEDKNKDNKANQFYLDTRFYFVNKDKFNMYAGLSFGTASLSITTKESFAGFLIETHSEHKSPFTRLAIGGNWYFTNKIGLWFNTEFNRHRFKTTYYSINGDPLDLTDWEQTLSSRGFQIALGVCIKFK